jgi:hypothetical protein
MPRKAMPKLNSIKNSAYTISDVQCKRTNFTKRGQNQEVKIFIISSSSIIIIT